MHRGGRRSHDAVGRARDERATRRTRRGNRRGRDVHRLAKRDGDGGLRGFAAALGRGDRRRGPRRPHRRRSLHAAHGVSPRARRARALERARRRPRRRAVGGEPARRLRRPHGAGSLRRERRDGGSRTNVRVRHERGTVIDPAGRRTSTRSSRQRRFAPHARWSRGRGRGGRLRRALGRPVSPHPVAIRPGDQSGQSAHVEPTRVHDCATPVRRRRALASPSADVAAVGELVRVR